jgi:hypothetical protein
MQLWQPFDFRGEPVMTFRTLDQLMEAPKGTAFRAFKQVLDELEEGRDHQRLVSGQDEVAISELKEQGRIYPSSVHVVLLHRAAVERMQPVLEPGSS